MARNCPECQQSLNHERFHGVDLDICTECAGLWFDPAELRKLITSDPIAIFSLDDHIVREIKHGVSAPSHLPLALHCPDCAMPLTLFHYEYSSPVQMNACPDCGGFWMLEQELQKLQQWLDHERHTLEGEEETDKIKLARIQMEHDEVIRRQESLGRLFRLMQMRVPHWFVPILPLSQ
jgi:Zn-finger nucleic acid-binding protein